MASLSSFEVMNMAKKPKPAGPREVTCQWPNVWTSKGKIFKGDKITLDVDEIKALGEAVK